MKAQGETSSARQEDEGIAKAMSRSLNEAMRSLSLCPLGVKTSRYLRR